MTETDEAQLQHRKMLIDAIKDILPPELGIVSNRSKLARVSTLLLGGANYRSSYRAKGTDIFVSFDAVRKRIPGLYGQHSIREMGHIVRDGLHLEIQVGTANRRFIIIPFSYLSTLYADASAS